MAAAKEINLTLSKPLNLSPTIVLDVNQPRWPVPDTNPLNNTQGSSLYHYNSYYTLPFVRHQYLDNLPHAR